MRRIIADLCSPYFIAYKALSHLARPRFPVSSGDWASLTSPGTVNLFPQHGSPGPKPPAHDPLPWTPGHWMPQRMPPTPGMRTKDLASEKTSLLEGLWPPVTALPSRKHANEGPERWEGGSQEDGRCGMTSQRVCPRGLERTVQGELRSISGTRQKRRPWRVIIPLLVSSHHSGSQRTLCGTLVCLAYHSATRQPS